MLSRKKFADSDFYSDCPGTALPPKQKTRCAGSAPGFSVSGEEA